jgi:DNA polymerase-4
MGRARQLCPHLRIVPPHYDLYPAVSRKVIDRLFALTPLVEQISIDEAFLDEPTAIQWRELAWFARYIQRFNCLVSGVAAMLAAKIATTTVTPRAGFTWKPPNAIIVATGGSLPDLCQPKPLGRRTQDSLRPAAELASHD